MQPMLRHEALSQGRAEVAEARRAAVAAARVVNVAEEAEVVAKMRDYAGPLNAKGYPKNKPLKEHLGIWVRGARKRRLWDQAQAEGG